MIIKKNEYMCISIFFEHCKTCKILKMDLHIMSGFGEATICQKYSKRMRIYSGVTKNNFVFGGNKERVEDCLPD